MTVSPRTHEKYLFVPELEYTCYPVAPLAEAYNRVVLNVPSALLQTLDGAEKQVVHCATLNCQEERELLARRYQQYQGAFRTLRQLMLCVDTQRRNANPLSFSGLSGSKSDVPDNCPKEDVEAGYLKARALVEELDQRLFVQPIMLPPATKTTQN